MSASSGMTVRRRTARSTRACGASGRCNDRKDTRVRPPEVDIIWAIDRSGALPASFTNQSDRPLGITPKSLVDFKKRPLRITKLQRLKSCPFEAGAATWPVCSPAALVEIPCENVALPVLKVVEDADLGGDELLRA